jgi:putative membrane protein
MKKKVFVVCIDRDNDLGRKTKIAGPVLGREKNLEAAQKLILADPEESDANTMFAAVKKLEEARKEFKNVEIVTLTGVGKTGLQSDKEISRQLDTIQKDYLIDGWILVTDGAEDAQTIPLLQSRGKIISTETVVIKQAPAVESTFYTLKEALRDPGIARLVLGVPGIMLLAYFALGIYSIQAMALILGTYLLLKGFGIEEKIFDYLRLISTTLIEQRISVVLYVAAMLSPFFGLWLAYIQLISSEFIDITVDVISAARLTYPFLALAVLLVLGGKIVDAFYLKKVYKLGKYFVQAASILGIWAIIDAGTLVFLRQAEIGWFPLNIMASLILMVIMMRVSKLFDVKHKVTKVMIGLAVMDEEGNYVGRISSIDKKKQSVTLKDEHDKTIEKTLKQFTIKQGRVIVPM